MLFDIGPYGDMWLANTDRLGVDRARISTMFLSHWHADHSGGFPTLIKAVADARSAAGIPAPMIGLHPDRLDQHRLQPEPTLTDIQAASGEIPRITDYETGLPVHHHFDDDDGVATDDPLRLDQRLLSWVRALAWHASLRAD